MRSALKFLSGSAVTYALMAACADRPKPYTRIAMVAGNGGTQANGGSMAFESDAMTGGGGSPSEVPAGGNGSVIDAAADAMLDPVPDAAAEPATDGSRLKAVYLVGDDGAKQFSGWWDSKLNAECSFTPFADGSTRCVPAAAGFSLYFSDSGCSTRVFVAAVAQQACVAPSAVYGLGQAAISCGVASYPAIYKLTTVDPPKVYSGTPASCSDITTSAKPSPPTYTFYTGAEVPLSSFVAATKQHG